MEMSAENYLTDKEKIVIRKLEEDYKITKDIKSYQCAKELLLLAETRRYKKEKGVEFSYDYI